MKIKISNDIKANIKLSPHRECPPYQIVRGKESDLKVDSSGENLSFSRKSASNSIVNINGNVFGGICIGSGNNISINGTNVFIDGKKVNPSTVGVETYEPLELDVFLPEQLDFLGLEINGVVRVQLDLTEVTLEKLSLISEGACSVQHVSSPKNNLHRSECFVSGSSSITLFGLKSQKAKIEVDGASKVKLQDCTFMELMVDVDGASNVQGSCVSAQVADCRASGASRISGIKAEKMNRKTSGVSSID